MVSTYVFFIVSFRSAFDFYSLTANAFVRGRSRMREQVLNKLDEFEDAVRKTVRDVRLDNDVVVSVFETNIRVLGYDAVIYLL